MKNVEHLLQSNWVCGISTWCPMFKMAVMSRMGYWEFYKRVCMLGNLILKLDFIKRTF